MSAHLPGPWRVARGRIVETADGSVAIAMLNLAAPDSVSDANARLIAAAPKMLAVLQKLRRGDLHQRVRPLYDEAQEAIAEATK